jgi:DNA polymerase III delta prime subunit
MNLIREHFNKHNLHHAYLIEGERKEILPEILEILKGLQVTTSGNPDFIEITVDSFKIDNARELKELASSKAFGGDKKIFVISAENILLEAQNALLKLFEEPASDTHFFFVLPDANVLLGTFASRFYRMSARDDSEPGAAKRFVQMNKSERIKFLQELLADEEGGRKRANKFLNELEAFLHHAPMSRLNLDIFEQIFRAREFLRQPGSSAKNLLESIALMTPVLSEMQSR